MAQLALYVDNELMKQLDRAAKLARVSRSQFVADAVRERLEGRLPESFFEVLGTWEDDRSPAQVMRDIRKAPRDRRTRVR